MGQCSTFPCHLGSSAIAMRGRLRLVESFERCCPLLDGLVITLLGKDLAEALDEAPEVISAAAHHEALVNILLCVIEVYAPQPPARGAETRAPRCHGSLPDI
jgi:hypothetical protein